MKASTKITLRAAAAALGALALTGATGVAMATADENHGDNDVDVSVQVQDLTEPGALAMTVAGASTALTENGSNAAIRQFTGTLPTVTVTDTRTAEEIPAGAFWYVLGSATDFVGDAGQDPISASYLGWAPRLISADPGSVAAGDPVFSSVDEPDPGSPDPSSPYVGLVDEELFAMASDSGAIAEEGTWTATADLTLRTPATVDSGTYHSTITLSLFE